MTNEDVIEGKVKQVEGKAGVLKGRHHRQHGR